MQNKSDFYCHIDILNKKRCIGWIIDKNDPTRTLDIQIILKGKILSNSTADILRIGTKEQGLHKSGNCGFDCDINISEDAVSDVVIKSDNTVVYGSIKDTKSFLKILIVGLAKTGTTALFYYVKSLFDTSETLFEHGSDKSLIDSNFHNIENIEDNVVSKSLFYQQTFKKKSLNSIADKYDKRILIIRDPRDVLISIFFYVWNKQHSPDKEKFYEALELVKKKEANPDSVSFKELMETVPCQDKNLLEQYENLYLQMKELDENWFIFKYKDLVDKNFTELNNYLSIEVPLHKKEINVSSAHSRVVRTKSYNNWKNWFTKTDCEYYKGLFNPILDQFGFDSTDWNIIENSKLSPETGSQYMLKIFG